LNYHPDSKPWPSISRIRILASSPPACLKPAGRFHGGATGGKLDSIASGSVEHANV
jgi:hypothetical protein